VKLGGVAINVTRIRDGKDPALLAILLSNSQFGRQPSAPSNLDRRRVALREKDSGRGLDDTGVLREGPGISIYRARLMGESSADADPEHHSPVLCPRPLESRDSFVAQQESPEAPTRSRQDRRYRLSDTPFGWLKTPTS